MLMLTTYADADDNNRAGCCAHKQQQCNSSHWPWPTAQGRRESFSPSHGTAEDGMPRHSGNLVCFSCHTGRLGKSACYCILMGIWLLDI